MATPQPGVFDTEPRFHYQLELRVVAKAETAALAQALRAARAAGAALAGRSVTFSFGRGLWNRLASDACPSGWNDFATIEGSEGLRAPSTQTDLWIWIQSAHPDENLAGASELRRALADCFELVLDLPTFVYLDSRDLTGFIDGTANPKEDERAEVALIASGEVGQGGSFSMTQRWVHDLDSFGALSVADQERVIGRTKPDSIELEGEAMPNDSHVSRTDVKLDGQAMKIWRRSTPWGTVTENGLYFVAFACEQRRFQVQLERMFGVSGDGVRDRLMGYSRAVSGSYWFTPSVDSLDLALAP